MRGRFLIYNIIVVIFVATASSCAVTTLEPEWFDHTFQGGPIKKVLVIGMFYIPEENEIFEEECRKQLASRNILVVTGHTIFEEGELPNEDKLTRAVKEKKIDFVLVGKMVKVNETGTFYEPLKDPKQFYAHHILCCQIPVSSGRDILIETKIFEGSHNKMIWSAKSNTLLEESFENTVEYLISGILRDLQHKKLVE